MDNAAGMLARCRDRVNGATLALVQGEASRLSLRDGSMDAAVCVGVLEHLPGDIRVRALAEMARVVRADGRLVLVANNAASELLRRPGDNPHRRATQLENGYFCALVGADEVIGSLGSHGWRARVRGANPFYSLLRYRGHAEPPLGLDGPALERAFDLAVDLDLSSAGESEADRRWADHFFIVAERG
jgi:SAM-dependent methyltransferase